MKNTTKYIITAAIIGFLAGFQVGGFYVIVRTINSNEISSAKPHVVEQLMSIQQQIGCEKIDGKWGPEMIRVYNPIMRQWYKDKFNEYAEPYFTPSGRPEK